MAQGMDAVIVVGGKNSGNTRRLAEIVKAANKPAFHVESEEEIDIEALSGFETIGITAGASTPSWIIKRILRSVEQWPLKRWQGWRSFILSTQRFLLLTNLYVALGAGCLCYAAMQLQARPVLPEALAAAVLYVISMHILNHLTGSAEDKYNDPDREKFYRSHRVPLVALALSAGAMGLVAAYQMGFLAFWTLLAMSILGLSYNLRLVPKRLAPKKKIRRIRDLPGSKTILIALAWGVITAALPALANPGDSTAGAGVTFLWATGLVFGRTAFFDILDMQGDRIVGKETIPVLIGQERSLKMLKVILTVVTVLLISMGALGVVSPLAYPLAFCPLLLILIVTANQQGRILPGIRLEFRVESLFVFNGLLAFLYALL
jgi:4-hydroxy-3-methylbut-2-enyl diphosphate reductase